MFLYEFAEKTAQKPDTVATYVRRNKKIFKNHVERRQKQIWLDEKAVDILLKKYPIPSKIASKNKKMKPTDKIFCNTFGTHFQMYYKMRILPVIFLARTSVLHFA